MWAQWGIDQTIIESDSQLAVTVVRDNQVSFWRYVYLFRDYMKMVRDSYAIVHAYIQSNMAADSLALWAHSHQQRLEIVHVILLLLLYAMLSFIG